jgi:F420-dependent oxidoreductase-like protein
VVPRRPPPPPPPPRSTSGDGVACIGMGHPVHFGIKAAGQDISIQELRAVWQIAEEGGFDHLWDYDHLAAIGDGGPDRPVFEGWALLAAMAQATSRVRIGCMVTGNTYRHPVLLAKVATTVDHLSGGRLEFGIGAAWAEVEHRMYGFEGLDHRVGRLSESLRVIRSLWTQPVTDFEGRYYRLAGAVANPRPVQAPHPPIWIGAGGEQTLRLVARHADVWNVSGELEPERVREQTQRLEEACAAIERDPRQIRRSVQLRWDGVDAGALSDSVGTYLGLGFTEIVLYVPGEGARRIAARVAELLPELRRLDP